MNQNHTKHYYMRQFMTLFTLVILLSCGQKDKKQEEPVSNPVSTVTKITEPEMPVKDTVLADTTIQTPQLVAGENEISIAFITKKTKDVPAYKSTGIYLHANKKIDGSYVFLGPANEWGVISINGKIEKLKFVKGYEDEATYANKDYELSYSLSYLHAPEGVENPTVQGLLIIKRKGYITYRGKIWGEWGVD